MSEHARPQPDMKLEVVLIGVTDVDRAKEFYGKLGWRMDGDFPKDDGTRIVQMTPHNSQASIIFGKGVTEVKPGETENLVLAVDNLDAAREDLLARGAHVTEIFHFEGGPFDNALVNGRAGGRDPEGRSYFSFASFEDPDGNGWLLQEIPTRLPGRLWKSNGAGSLDVEALAEFLREAEQHHGPFEKTHAKHNWWDWYSPYISARQSGSSPEKAASTANKHMEQVFHIPAR